MQWIDRTKLSQKLMAGTFLNLGSPTTVEIASNMDFDWLLIDFEHGCSTVADVQNLLRACRGSKAAPIVRIRSVDPDVVKYVMDSGAAGVMFPWVSSAEEAAAAVQSMKYPPIGQRGTAGAIRATDFGCNWKSYFEEANAQSLVVVQIETPEAVDACEDIAAVDGVDVLFVGPLDLSVNMGHPGDFTPKPFHAALQRVVDACKANGKSAGILSKPGHIDEHKSMGFRLFALSSDMQSVTTGLQNTLAEIVDQRS